MNSRIFIHALLIAVLCFGQLAASVHVSGHLYTGQSDANTTCEMPESLSNTGVDTTLTHPHPHSHATGNGATHANTTSGDDCAIYHLYAGQSTCPANTTSDFSTPLHIIYCAAIRSVHVVQRTLLSRPIRAPPLS